MSKAYEYNEGPKARENFEKGMKTLFQVPKDAVLAKKKARKKRLSRASRCSPNLSTGEAAITDRSGAGSLFTADRPASDASYNIKPEPAEGGFCCLISQRKAVTTLFVSPGPLVVVEIAAGDPQSLCRGAPVLQTSLSIFLSTSCSSLGGSDLNYMELVLARHVSATFLVVLLHPHPI